MHVIAGTDTYGCVKIVCGTPIVTKFLMLQMLPLFPLKSYYFIGIRSSESSGVPFFAHSQTTVIEGFELSRVDRISAIMAYVRCLLAIMLIVGLIGPLFALITYLNGEELNELAVYAVRTCFTLLALSCVGGAISYAIPFTSTREREIRTYCWELLGIAIDPARISAEIAQQIVLFTQQTTSVEQTERKKLLASLVVARARIALQENVQRYEIDTDTILTQLRIRFG